MKIKTTAGSLLCALSLVASSVVHADAQASGETAGSWYLGIGLGISELDPDTGNTGYSISDKRDTGVKLFGGYDFGPRFSAEAFYADLGASSLSHPALSRPDGEIEYRNFGISALWHFWRNGEDGGDNPRRGWQAYVHGGLSFLDNSASAGIDIEQNRDVQLKYGAAIEYGLQQGYALRAGFDLYDVDAGLAYVSVLKRFGSAKKRKPVVVEPAASEEKTAEEKPAATQAAAQQAAAQAVVVPVPVVVSYDRDSDGDGVADRLDQCADSSADFEVDDKGCSVIPVDVAGVNFAAKSHELTAESKAALDEAVVLINASPELQKIEVQAHTDSVGSEEYNLKLSEQRAASVMDYLVSRGVDARRLVSRGYGESQPVADNSTEAGRAKNRRVELKVIQEQPAAGE